MTTSNLEAGVLLPRAFGEGLDVWSREDGTPGSASYDGASDAALIASDQDFAGALELVKTEPVQRLRYTGRTPVEPGRYLRITARVKAVSGPLPTLRIAGWAGAEGGSHVPGLTEAGPEVTLTGYGAVTRISAVVGTGARPGADLVWNGAAYGHFGLDMTGPTGGVVRIDDIVIEDATGSFLRQMLDWVDVRDYGAAGDGVTDDSAAFAAADAAAAGRRVLVPAGEFRLAGTVTFASEARFVGTVAMAPGHRLVLTRNFDLPTYIDAFGSEMEGFRRAVQALFNFNDHESLDMKGRRVEVTEPIDMHAAIGNRASFAVRRVIRNGKFNVVPGPAWDTGMVTASGDYDPADPLVLSGLSNAAQVPVGALVSAPGVGREVYVRGRDPVAGTLTLSKPLFGAAGRQGYTFRRFRYVLDFGGFTALSRFVLSDVEVQCNGTASGVMLPPDGIVFHLRDCFLTAPKDRGITSVGRGCQGMLIDRCQFISNEQPLRAQDRTSIGFNVNANDVKLRENRAVRFAHFGVMSGSGHVVTANHWFQGDTEPDAIRQAGLVLTEPNLRATIAANYIDNCFIELTNEHDAHPAHAAEYSFGGLSVTANTFFASDVAPWFRWLVIKPYGAGHYIAGLAIAGNSFKAIGGKVDRVEHVDTTHAELDPLRMRNIVVEGNSFTGVAQRIANPVTLQFDQNSEAATWHLGFGPYLPFGGRARNATGVVAEEAIRGSGGGVVTAQPYCRVARGPGKDMIDLVWPEPARGRVHVTARMDNPV